MSVENKPPAEDPDVHMKRLLDEQVQQLGDWNAHKDSDESWKRDADKVKAQMPKTARSAPGGLANLLGEIVAAVAGRLALIGAVVVVLALLAGGMLWWRGRVAPVEAPAPSMSNAVIPDANAPLPDTNAASAAANAANAANAVSANITSTPGKGSIAKAGAAKPGAMRMAAGPKPGAAPGDPDAEANAAMPPASAATSNAAPKPATAAPASKPATASTTTGHRAHHSLELMARLHALWVSGGEAKHRDDYATARRDWSAALRLCPGHPGFQSSIDTLPR